jgi:hypothetical protein
MPIIELPHDTWRLIVRLQRHPESSCPSLQESTRAAVHNAIRIRWGDASDNFVLIRCTDSEALDLLNWCGDASKGLAPELDRTDEARMLEAARAVRAGISRTERR